MREYEQIPVGQWVVGTRKVQFNTRRVKIQGWIEKHKEFTCIVYVPADKRTYEVTPEYLFSMEIEVDKPTLIDMALEKKDEEWFKQLTEV